MQCRTHPTVSATNTCNHCGNWLCDDCTVNVQGRLFCRPCLATFSQDHKPEPPPYTAPPHSNKVSLGLLLFFSLCFPPGANYMYMGLIKRGLATMAGFFLLIFFIAGSSFPFSMLLVFSLVVLIFSSIFDGFNVRRRLNAGEAVRDDVGDVVNSVISNKFLRTIIFVIIAILLIVSVLQIATAIIGRLLPLLVIGLVIFIVIKRKPPLR